jgi:hypothetical protein
LVQPPVPVEVYEIIAVPALSPITTPEELLTVATDKLELLQTPPEVVAVKLVVPPTQIACVPERTAACGGAVTVSDRTAVASAQPPVPKTVYVSTVKPADKPTTLPAVLTDAIVKLLRDQLPPVPVELKLLTAPTHIFPVPVMVPALGTAVTVTRLLAVALAQPPLPATV